MKFRPYQKIKKIFSFFRKKIYSFFALRFPQIKFLGEGKSFIKKLKGIHPLYKLILLSIAVFLPAGIIIAVFLLAKIKGNSSNTES